MDFSSITLWTILIVWFFTIQIINYILKKSSFINTLIKLEISLLGIILLGMVSLESLFIFISVLLLAWIGCKCGFNLSIKKKKILLGGLISILLLPLLYYKYADFLLNDVSNLKFDTLRDIIIPVGISFYTFQIISFCIDTLLRGNAIPKFIDYFNFCGFFPQIVAGPIERRDDLLPQMQNINLTPIKSNYEAGIPFVILGLFFKLCLADNLAVPFDSAYKGDSAYVIWFNNLLFTFRIYFDFAGYGLTAYGLAKCLGINLRMNFLSPYTATNITEFWRRWHTSLTLWFRDYIYFSMGGSRTKSWALNILIVFTISGVWHGAGWNFIMWGAFAGIAMVLHRLFRNKGFSLPSYIGWALTFCMMVFVWMFFYDTDNALLYQHINTIFSTDAYNFDMLYSEIQSNKSSFAIAFVFIPLSFLTILFELFSIKKYGEANPYQIFLSPYACGIMCFLMVIFRPSIQNSFIYFAF